MLDLRLPRTARLLQPADFTALRGRSARLSTRHFVAEYLATPGSGPRLGMAVSRKVSKRAVVRNRIRRTIRESFRLHRARLPCIDILVIARNVAASQINVVLRTDLDTIWSKLAAVEIDATLKPTAATGTMRAGS